MIYKKKPEGFVSHFEVSGCLVDSDGQILLLRRIEGKSFAGCYGTPGGKKEVKDGNNSIVTAKREVEEETGIILVLENIKKIGIYYVDHNGKNFIYHHHYYLLVGPRPEVVLEKDEHDAYIWIHPVDSLNLPLVEDEDFVIKDAFSIQ